MGTARAAFSDNLKRKFVKENFVKSQHFYPLLKGSGAQKAKARQTFINVVN